MVKISGILPSSPRVTSVDLSSARPVRPGVPGFGSPQGVSALGNAARFTKSSLSIGPDIGPGHIDWDSQNRSTIADEISNEFFAGNDVLADEIAAGPIISPEVLLTMNPVPTPISDPVPVDTEPGLPNSDVVEPFPETPAPQMPVETPPPSPASAAAMAYKNVATGPVVSSFAIKA